MNRTGRGVLLALLAVMATVSVAGADIVALKRSPGLTLGIGLDSRFATLISGGTINVITGQDVAGDTDMWTDTGWAASNCYCNYGGAPSIRSGATFFLSKFRVQTLPGFVGGRINKAQVRFYYTGGNTGLGKTGYVISSDWTEGTRNQAYPGAAGGASGAHPNGRNTAANQNADGGTTPPLQSWANNNYFAIAKDVSATFVGVTKTGYSGGGDTYGGFAVFDVTSIVQLWANGTPNYGFCTYDSGWNYSILYSENTKGADYQPVLLLDYDQHGTPNAVTNLAAGDPDWFKLVLTWTAPSANPPGPVASYDIRMSTSPIPDDAAFAAATPLTGVPTPAAPGTAESFTVAGLSASTTYYFAMKVTDAVGTVSALSNPASGTTNPLDVVAPAAVADLAAPGVKPNYATLTWTAVGDDGMTGVAAGYDLRYSTAPITDDASFEAATAATGLAAPKSPGQAETFTIHGLSPSTTYWFAIKTKDEVPNWSSLSNVVAFTTLEADPYAPNAIADLAGVPSITMVYVSWTAPADVGTAGLAGYDLRYSTAAIDEANWAAATQVTGEPVPAAPGTSQDFIVTGLQPSTTYHFAIKSFDYAEPANVSAISNVPSVTTQPPIAPVVVHNPWLKSDRVADTHNIATMGATYVNAYTPDGVVPPASDEAKAINIYNNQKRRLYHWADEPPSVGGNNIDDPTYTQNVFGWCLCGRHANNACTITSAAGLGQRKIGLPGHWIYEAQYGDGTYHAYDTMTTMYVYNKASPAKVASCAQMAADSTLLGNAVADGRACPGFLLCGDTVSWYQGAINSWSSGGSGVQTTRWTGNMDLRLGQSYKRTWESWASQHPTARTNADGLPGMDPPFHHEAQNDWKDYVNLPYWEPYAWNSAQNAAAGIGRAVSYRRWANGTDTLAPDFRSAGYQAMLESGSAGIAAYYQDAIVPDLHCATVNVQGEAIFKIAVPYYITDASFSGTFVKATSSDVCKVYFSSNGTSWTQVYDAPVGTTTVTNQSLRANVFGLWTTWYIKVQVKGAAALANAGVSNFVVVTTFEHNKGAMAYLDKGVNHITLTFDNAAELQASRNVLHVVYQWKEYDGSGWNVDRFYNGYFTASPSTFTIATGGTKVPRTEYILMEVIPPVLDPVPPGQITDLANGAPGPCRVPLTWTATGDDGTVGTAMAYDLRYSASPITDDAAFDAATQVAGVPAPGISGSSESFTVTGLTPLTTYYFAIKAIDKGNNRGPLSNCAGPVTTTELLPVADLAAGTPTWSVVPLTWTAIDDGSVGRETSYDLRCSTSPITDANFSAATQVTGLPAPKPAGAAESFSVKGLLGGTTYYFAIKGTDALGQASPVSNIATATTAPTPAISDLAASSCSNKVYLAWTAIDDGNLGTMSSYNLRYSSSPIVDDASFNAATAASGIPAPKAAGAAESFLVTGLLPSTTYYFAIKAVDSFGHASALSNVAAPTTTSADIARPVWIGNLKAAPSGTSGGVDLTWTAPSDTGSCDDTPMAVSSYEVRYSTSPILYNDGDATWNAAAAVAGVPTPTTPGSVETFTVSGLTGGTTYYFAIKSTDDSGNVSEVSNCTAAAASALGNKTLQNGLNSYTGCIDTYIDMTTTNWGSIERMTICGYGPGNYQRGLVKFNVSGIPAGTVITRATLSLFSYNDGQRKGSTGFYGAYKLTADWTYNQCNWNVAKTGVNWTTAGGDFLADPDGTAPKQGVAQVWYSFDVTARVQAWINNSADNYGWMIKCTDEALSNQDWLYQSDTGTADKRPKLVVSDLPVPVPGDINADGGVDVVDLLYLVDAFGATCGTDRVYDPRCDFNTDGTVDVVDLLYLVDYWPQ